MWALLLLIFLKHNPCYDISSQQARHRQRQDVITACAGLHTECPDTLTVALITLQFAKAFRAAARLHAVAVPNRVRASDEQ